MASNLQKSVSANFSSTALTGTYQNVGSAMTGPVYAVTFVNPSTVACLFTDGTSVWQVGPATTVTYPVIPATTPHGHAKLNCPSGVQFQVKQVTAAGAGTNDIAINAIIER